ncbi:MAG TPA: efflux RND transporter periplasmic adaptor subunit [Candidatus Paceibacterota bacterium]|nr:efflux RND transporter periplasmic adaptor subunit [Verrucomicrobiota bacterium]HOX01421.1 efflux RND transporter periplasmic adaptor subunit [Verrucomicrobiota bacterium]HRZ44456.1 efflux RND transporter periplasmic adaptor subunit [Candidatus Paceibacterota bacterium]HRZ92692.1 efflux RND transporter periplasmic adaptor subunit [Candidatus Paceibacterota bacterium]
MNALAQQNAAASRSASSHRHRRWLPYGGAMALAALIVAGLWPQPVPVETGRVAVGSLQSYIQEEGKTRIQHRYVLSAPVTGQLRRIPYKAGFDVTGGKTVLAQIEPLAPGLLDARSRTQAEARRNMAAASLEKARAALQFARSERERIDRLYAQKAVSIQELEPAQWRETAAAREMAVAENALRQAEAELAEFQVAPAAHADPRTIEVLAPASGRVLRVFDENARVVTAGTPLVEVGDPANLEVVIEVLSRDGAALKPGAKVELDQWGGHPPLEARIRLVEPAAFTKVSALGVEEQRVNAIADLITPPELRPGLGDQFRVEARILVWETDRALKAPAGALFRRGDQWMAFVVQDGRARLRAVQTGHSNGIETQILEGLQEGDPVILYPSDRVTDGRRVREIRI